MVEWWEQASQWHEMYCHDLEVMSSKPGRVELGVRSTSALSRTWTKNIDNQIKRTSLRSDYIIQEIVWKCWAIGRFHFY